VPVESLGPGVRRDDGRENEFSALIIAEMAMKICRSDSGVRRDDGKKISELRGSCIRLKRMVRGNAAKDIVRISRAATAFTPDNFGLRVDMRIVV
jgi:hypothetical protein